jgi:hypothetical protein
VSNEDAREAEKERVHVRRMRQCVGSLQNPVDDVRGTSRRRGAREGHEKGVKRGTRGGLLRPLSEAAFARGRCAGLKIANECKKILLARL